MLNVYATDVIPLRSRPAEAAQRIAALAGFMGTKTLADINGALCRAYVKKRTSRAMARRELEDLRAAINHHRREGLCDRIIDVVLPERAPPRDRYLERHEVAAALWAAWRFREIQKGRATGRRSRRHVAKFILVGCYTGTRAGAICGASFERVIGRGFVDLQNGVFYRRAQGARETKKRQPPVRLPDRLLVHLRLWKAAQDREIAAERNACAARGDVWTPRLRAVVEFNGEPVDRVSKAFARVMAAVGVTDATPHTLRHTAATWAMQGGADLWDAAGYFGMSVETLQRVYGHHRPDQGADVAKAIRAKRSQPVRQPVRKAENGG